MALRAIPTKAMLRSDANCLAEAIGEIKYYRKLIESLAKVTGHANTGKGCTLVVIADPA